MTTAATLTQIDIFF